MQVISSLAALDAKLAEVEAALRRSPLEGRRLQGTFRMASPDRAGLDPHGEAYRAAEFALYQTLAGKPYAVENETDDGDPMPAIDRPYPFFSGDFEAIGNNLMIFGWIFKTMRLAPGRTVLELGPGWSNITLAMARAGLKVTAIEFAARFIAYIEERARREGVSVEALQGEFMSALQLKRRFDAVLFYASFHHSADHGALLDGLDELVTPGGIVVFANEPVTESFGRSWGLRLDGESLWAIRRWGWLELGFSESYFRDSLKRRGWLLDKHPCPEPSAGAILIARRARDVAAGESVQIPLPATRGGALRSLAKTMAARLPLGAQRAAYAIGRSLGL